jgi:hypothetical protein
VIPKPLRLSVTAALAFPDGSMTASAGSCPSSVDALPKKAVEGAVNMIRSHTGPRIPAVELIEMPNFRTTRFDEDAREYEITIKVPPKRVETAA